MPGLPDPHKGGLYMLPIIEHVKCRDPPCGVWQHVRNRFFIKNSQILPWFCQTLDIYIILKTVERLYITENARATIPVVLDNLSCSLLLNTIRTT